MSGVQLLYAHVEHHHSKAIDVSMYRLPIKWGTFQSSTTKDAVVNWVEKGFNRCHRNPFANATAVFGNWSHEYRLPRSKNSLALYKSAS